MTTPIKLSRMGVVNSLGVGLRYISVHTSRIPFELPNVTFTAVSYSVQLLQIQASTAVCESLIQTIRHVRKDSATQSDCQSLMVGLSGERTVNHENWAEIMTL